MPRTITFEDKPYLFPDDASNDEIANALTEYTKPAKWGEVGKAIPGILARTGPKLLSGVAQTVGDVVGSAALKDSAQLAREGMEEEERREIPRNRTLMQDVAITAAGSVKTAAEIAALTAGGMATMGIRGIGKAASIATSAMGAETGLNRYSDLRDDNKFSPSRAGVHAVFEGLVEKYTEYMPAKYITGSGPWAREAMKYLTRDLGGEIAATTLQDLSAKLSDRPDMTLGEFARDLAVTALATPVTGAAQFGLYRGVGALLPSSTSTERTIPETEQTLLEQQVAVVEGRKPAQMFPTGTEELPLPAGMERVETPRGVFHINPSLTTKADVIRASESGEENKILGLGPVTKMEAAASGQPVAVVERTKSGTEVLTAATTLERLQETLDQLKSQAAKGNTVAVEDPNDVALGRLAEGVTPPKVIAPLPTATSPQAVAAATTPQVTPEPTAPAAPPTPTPSAVESRPTELQIRRGTNGTITVKFPNKNLKELFRLGNLLEQRDHSTNPPKPEVLQYARQQLAPVLNLGEAQTEEAAQIYHEVMRDEIKIAASGSTIPAMTVTQAKNRYVLAKYSPPTDLQSGVVALADGLLPTENTKNAKAYLQRWVKAFLPDAKVVIAGETTAGASASVTYYNGVHYVAIPKELQRGENITQWKSKWLFYLAHEFGHVIFNERFNNPENKLIAARLSQEHADLVSRVSTMTVKEFITAWYGPAWTMRLLQAKGRNSPEGSVYGIDARDPAWLLVAEVDRLHNRPGYTLSKEEWAAEQFARHVNNERSLIADDAETRGFWQSIYSKLTDFFDRVVKHLVPTETYKEFVNSLRTAPKIEGGFIEQDTPPLMNESAAEDERIKEEFQYTFKVLGRLPDKPLVKKVTIIQEKMRQDVRMQEKNLIDDVLAEMPGGSVDMQIFKQKLLSKIVPLRTSLTSKYAEYGLRRIGFTQTVAQVIPDQAPTRFLSTSQGGLPSVSPFTRIYNVPFETGGSGHFPGHPNYYAHLRAFNVPTVNGKTRVIMELQSDREQHEQTEEDLESNRQYYEESLVSVNSLILFLDKLNAKWRRVSINSVANARAVLVSLVNEIDTRLDDATIPKSIGRDEARSQLLRTQQLLLQHLDSINSTYKPYLTNNVLHPIQYDTLEKVGRLIQVSMQNMHAKSAEFEEKLKVSTADFSKLPKNWEQLVLLSEMQKAAQEGATRMWIPGSDETVAKVEGYEKGVVVDGEFNTRDENEWVPEDGERAEITESQLVYDPDVQPILRRYRDMAKWAKNSLGGKNVAGNGSQWIEIPLKEELITLPITYYMIGESVEEQIEDALPELTKVEETLPKAVKLMGRGFTNLLQLNQMAKLWPGLHGLQMYRRAMQSLHALKSKLFEGPNEQLRMWYKLPTKQGQLVEDALRAEVDSNGHWTELVKDPATEQWLHTPGEAMKRILTARGLSQPAQELFVNIKNDFMLTLQTMETVLREHVDKFFEKSPVVMAQRHAELDAMFRDLREKPYLPDSRFGQWSVQVRARQAATFEGTEIKKNDLLFWQKFETKKERDKALVEVRRLYGKSHAVSGSYDPDIVQTFSGMPGGFVTSMIEEMGEHESTKLSAEQVEALQELAFYQTRAGKFSRYLRTPKKMVGGASTDIRRVYAAYHWKTANAIAKMKFNRALRTGVRMVAKARETVRNNGGNSDQIDMMHQYLNENYQHVMHPENDWPRLRAFVSMWYLFASVKTALMNMSSLPVLAYPYLAARHGDVAATTAMVKAMRTVTQYWRNPNKVSPDVRAVLQKAREDGVTEQSFAATLASVSDGGVAFEKMMPKFAFMGNRYLSDTARKTTWRVMSMGMAPFRAIEGLNRQITLLAAYELESGKLGKTLSVGDTAAYDAARDAVDYTQNEYSAWNQPKFMWGGKSPFFLFYSFVQNMSFMMFGGDKSWWRAMMVLAVMGGFLALPGVENLIDMLNYAWRKFSGQHQDLRLEAREVFEAIGMNPDLAMHGLSHNLFGTGWDVSSSVGQGRVIPGTDAIFGIGKFEQRFVQAVGEVGGPMGGLAMGFLQALASDNPNQFLRFQNALPAAAKNLVKAYNTAETGEIQDSRGRALVQDATAMDVIGQAAGFRSGQAATVQELHRLQHDAAEFYMQRRSNLMEMFYNAKKTGNYEALESVQEAIEKYNDSVPDDRLKVTHKDLSASFKTRAKLETQFENHDSPQRKYQLLYQLLRESYEDSLQPLSRIP